MSLSKESDVLYLYYDGDCPLCSHVAKATRIRRSINLVLVDARSTDSCVTNLKQHYDLNDGIIIEFNNQIYAKEDALRLLALLSTPHTWFNRLIVAMIGTKIFARYVYPILKLLRRLLLWIRGKDLIPRESYPIFKPIFGDSWNKLPSVFRGQYANRAYSEDCTVAKGDMTIVCKSIFKPLFALSAKLGLIVPLGKNIATIVNFRSQKNSRYYIFQREFYVKNAAKPRLFQTRLLQIKDNEVIDIMKFGFAWRLKYVLEENNVKFLHCGYTWHILGLNIPLPLSFILGKMQGEETAISATEFKLLLELTHPLFGKIFSYRGSFELHPVMDD